MQRKCNTCNYVDKKLHTQNLADWLVTIGIVTPGAVYPAKECPKCGETMWPIGSEKSSKQEPKKNQETLEY